MKVLQQVTPTPEQLKVIQDSGPGVMLIRGAAGSGKTTTALLRLNYLTNFWSRRFQRLGVARPVEVLVLTYNRTLRGYISELARHQAQATTRANVEIKTFGKWAFELLGRPALVDERDRHPLIARLSQDLGLEPDFVMEELDYLLGRFPADRMNDYIEVTRVGRGLAPRMDKALRGRLLKEVVEPYSAWKSGRGLVDWNDSPWSLPTDHQAPDTTS